MRYIYIGMGQCISMTELSYQQRRCIDDGLRDASGEINSILTKGKNLGTQERKRLEKILVLITESREINGKKAMIANQKEEEELYK